MPGSGPGTLRVVINRAVLDLLELEIEKKKERRKEEERKPSIILQTYEDIFQDMV